MLCDPPDSCRDTLVLLFLPLFPYVQTAASFSKPIDIFRVAIVVNSTVIAFRSFNCPWFVPRTLHFNPTNDVRSSFFSFQKSFCSGQITSLTSSLNYSDSAFF
mmetsp:Transcript_23336/g.39156  ORF Transcript_23336/g.39156 Transcript_23336/m.39156 type:complete len:103 (+) Transcript_23336:4317-4625(+)